jgi:hypothetical protein
MRRILTCLPVLALAILGLTGCKASGTVDCPNLPTSAPTTTTSGTCTWTYTPDPPASTTTPPTTTTTVPPTTTTTTTVPPTTTTSSTPPPNAFPTPSTTGAPATTTFQPAHTGDMTISSTGTYDRLHVTGTLYINAPNVRVTNSWIEGKTGGEEALVNNSTGLQVSYTTIGSTGCNPQPGVGEANYTADHVKITGMGDGFRVSGNNVTIQDSFAQTCDHASNHDDGTQIFCPPTDVPQPCQNIAIDHNTLSVANTRNFTAPVFGGGDPGGSNGQIANSRITNNLLWGGVFTIDTAGKNLTITGNRIATNRWTMPDGSACEPNSTGVMTPQGCSYAGWVWGASAVAQSNSTCAQQTVTWVDNRAIGMDGNWQPNTAGTALNCA